MIVRLNGGLCNQMFQYAFGRSVSSVRKEPLFFHCQDLGPGCHRAYSLGAFNTIVNWADGMSGPEYGEPNFRFDPGVYNAPEGSFFKGCWQTEKYFNEPLVRKEFTLRKAVSAETNRVAEEISAKTSAFLHIRRTDYLKPHVAAYHGIMELDYYNAAVDYIRERVSDVRFFVFSDDPEWCRGSFPNARVVGHNKMGSGTTGPGTEHEDLFLMSLCNHAIIPNSTFGWWGAWLNKLEADRLPRIVIGPKVWFRNQKLEYGDVMPERWIKL